MRWSKIDEATSPHVRQVKMSVAQKEALREAFEPLRDKFFPLIVCEEGVDKWNVTVLADAEPGDEAPLLAILKKYHFSGDIPVRGFLCITICGHLVYIKRLTRKKYHLCFMNNEGLEVFYRDAKQKLTQYLIQSHSEEHPLVTLLERDEEPEVITDSLLRKIAEFCINQARKDYRKQYGHSI